MMIVAIAWNQFIPHLNVVDMINAQHNNVIGCPPWFIASLMKLSILRGPASLSKFVAFFERYDGNGDYVQGGVSKFIDTAAT